MASQESIIRRQVAANERVSVAIATLTRRTGIEPAEVPTLPKQIAPEYRSMIEREVLADALERLASNPMVVDLTDQNSEQQARIADLEAQVTALEATRAAAVPVADPSPESPVVPPTRTTKTKGQ